MEQKTLEALKGSIKKWAMILNEKTNDQGAANCPLCELFFYDVSIVVENGRKQCDGCPVFEKTKLRFCENTPFSGWKITQVKGKYNWADSPIKKEWAKREVDFLIDLLPEEERKNALVEHGL